MKKIALIIGATSSLGFSICRQLAESGYDLILCGRDEEELVRIVTDLEIRYSRDIKHIQCNFLSTDFSAQALLEQAGCFNKVFLITGDMGSGNKDDIGNIENIIRVNFIIPAQILTLTAEHLKVQGQNKQQEVAGIAVISSVAGDRGRQSNYPYGSAKAGLTQFVSGMRNRYSSTNVHIMTVKPGFLDTPMTYGMQSPLIASREYAAKKIISALDARKNNIYVPFYWKFIMMIICFIPESIFKKMNL